MSKFNLKEDLTWRAVLVRTGIVLAAMIVMVWVMPRDSRNYFIVEQGKPWKYVDFRAPFDFPVYRSDTDVKREQDSLMRTYEPYYNLRTETEGEMVRKFATDFANGLPGLPDDYVSIIANRLHCLYQTGIVSAPDYDRWAADTARQVQIVNGKRAISVHARDLYSTKVAYELLFHDETDSTAIAALRHLNLTNYITPNLIYDTRRSEQAKADLLASVALASGVVQKGQKIIDRGEIVDDTAYRTLESFKKENEKRSEDAAYTQVTMAGEALYVAIMLACFTLYLSLFRKDYFDKPRNIAMLYSLIVFFALLTSLLVRNTIGHVYILPYAIVPIFVRVFMDSRTAFITHFTMLMICGVMLQHPFDFVVIETVAGLAAIYSLRELQYRSQLFKTAIIVTLAAAATNLGYDMVKDSVVTKLDISYYYYFMVNGLLLLFAYPLLYLMEKVFGFTSDITLIELSNTNTPLLRRMSEVAPGTFQHSIQVGNLAAEIANKLGAKAQLVRTGALYHDIGKLANPVYFTENQSAVNPHEALTCIESAQVIISHVTEGLKMADKFNLPTVIRDFIATHHGQGKAKYFYVKYKNEHPDEPVDDLLFTYPGPNPFTKEQAILMMADAVEAASRSLPEYTEQRIRELVDRLLDGMVADGYFRECPITFRDIAYAKTVLIEKLKMVYHTRVSYPTVKKQ